MLRMKKDDADDAVSSPDIWKCLKVLEANENFLKWYRAYLSSAPGTNGNVPPPAPGTIPPGMPIMYSPFLHPNSFPGMSSMPQGLQPGALANAEYNQDTAHAEPSQPSQASAFSIHQQLLPPERQYHPRPQPLEEYREYVPVYPGYPEPKIVNGNYSVDQRELPSEPRPESRMDSNYVLVNREQRRLDQTWTPVNEPFFEGVSKVNNVMKPFPNKTDDPFFGGVSKVNNVMKPFPNKTEDVGWLPMFGPSDRRAMGVDRPKECASTAQCRTNEELEEEFEALARRIDTEFKSAY